MKKMMLLLASAFLASQSVMANPTFDRLADKLKTANTKFSDSEFLAYAKKFDNFVPLNCVYPNNGGDVGALAYVSEKDGMAALSMYDTIGRQYTPTQMGADWTEAVSKNFLPGFGEYIIKNSNTEKSTRVLAYPYFDNRPEHYGTQVARSECPVQEIVKKQGDAYLFGLLSVAVGKSNCFPAGLAEVCTPVE